MVEDDAINLKIITKMLENMNMQVDVAINGIQGVEAAKKKPYDLIFMDLNMPKMDGYQTTLEVRKSGAECPIIAFTASVFEEDVVRCIEAGMDDHLGENTCAPLFCVFPFSSVGCSRQTCYSSF